LAAADGACDMCKNKHDLAMAFLRDAALAGSGAIDPLFSETWCKEHNCTEADLESALEWEEGNTEYQVKQYEDEEFGRIVMEEARNE